ncbi:MAG: prephenate dehydratase [Candidatus Zixiibacteriota bacterium]
MARKKVAFQGERGAFSELAAHSLVGANIVPYPCGTFEQVFDAVESRSTSVGIVPIENSLIGSIHRNYDLLLKRNLHITGETQLRIRHCLVAPPGISFARITKAYSHPAALEQCRDFFAKQTRIAPISYYDTAGAAKMIAEAGLPNSAAIAGPYVAEIYNLKVLKKSIEDESTNFTRFLLLGRKPVKADDQAKTSIVFSMKNQPGVLFKALSVFALRDIDLTRIESRPVRKRAWQYHFYIDFSGSIREQRVRYALDHLSEITHFIKILGSYPQGLIDH